VPLIALVRAREVVASHRRDHEWLTLKELARELGVNIHTLRAAARTGRGRSYKQTTRWTQKPSSTILLGRAPNYFDHRLIDVDRRRSSGVT